ncbi:RNA methyltransferase [Erysipelotrichaceae bacterium MTC7]|nr:RNA methyltransferase [Erysipelotrichaceae bacterium MTC7]
MLLEGNISVKAALLSPYRKVNKILIDIKKRGKDSGFIIFKAKEQNVPIEYLSREEIDSLASGKTHGGLLAEVEERTYQDITDVIDDTFIAYVEGIEDPFNFGYIIRSLYAAGCTCIITNERNWSNAATTVTKASAGANEYMKHITTTAVEKTIKDLQNLGFNIIAAARDDTAIEMYDYDFTNKVCICIGGEKRGLSKDILEQSNQHVYIPYNTDFKNALNAVAATTILSFEVVRQRRVSHP